MPNFLDSLLERYRKDSEEISNMLETLIRESREALGAEADDIDPWDGIPRREIRDR